MELTEIMELTGILRALNFAHSPSGDEGDISALIYTMARPWADEITSDVMGNLVAHKKGNGPKVMFAAHMDSIGFIVTHIEKEGFLRVGKLGGISPKDVLNTRVCFKNGVRGVLVAEEKTEDKVKLEDCYIDIGARDEEQARTLVQVGDTAVYDTAVYNTVAEVNGRVISPYLDGRIACAVLLKAMEQVTARENDLYFVFTVQEEVGTRGAKTAAWSRPWSSVPRTRGSSFSGTSSAPAGPTPAPSMLAGPVYAPAASPFPAAISIPPRRWLIWLTSSPAWIWLSPLLRPSSELRHPSHFEQCFGFPASQKPEIQNIFENTTIPKGRK